MKDQLYGLVKKYAKEQLRPDSSPFLSINLASCSRIMDETGYSLYEIEGLALEKGITPRRYARNQRILTVADQLCLHKAHVAIIGLGGLGGGVTELLSRAGVGRMTLVDGDVFDETNLNRQLLSSASNIGMAKAEIAAQRVLDINPSAQVQAHQVFLDDNNGSNLVADTDLAIDCLDTISARFCLERVCREKKIALVSAAIAGQCGQATTIRPEETGLANLYGEEKKAPERGVEAGLGTLGFAAAYMASIECAEAIKLILGKESPLQGGLLFSDLSDYSLERVQIS